jgi:hypothetical protein
LKRLWKDNGKIILVAMLTAMVTAGAPAIAHGVQHALFAHNADKVDGKHAVGAGATVNSRKGKLVATKVGNGRLPNNIIVKAPDANKLDGLNSTAFARGSARVEGVRADDIVLGQHDVFSIPGVGTLRASCGFSDIPFEYRNDSGDVQNIVVERAGAYSEVENLADGGIGGTTPAAQANGVTYQVAGPSGATAIFIVHAAIANGTDGPCIYQGTRVSSPAAAAAVVATSSKAPPQGRRRVRTP